MITLLEIIGVTTGIIGCITGVISLIWLIKNDLSKLKLEYVYFKKGGFRPTIPYDSEIIGIKLNLKNLSNKSTTIEEIYIRIGNEDIIPHFFKPVKISENSSYTFEYEQIYLRKEYKKLMIKKPIKFGITIKHTFGIIRKHKKNDFKTGHFTIEG